jgi:hypothetical protein
MIDASWHFVELLRRLRAGKAKKPASKPLRACADESWRAQAEKKRNTLRAERAEVGMGDFVESAESEAAEKLLEAVQKKPAYEDQFHDILRCALRAGKPVPHRGVVDFLDEPWAVAEMTRRARNLGMRLFTLSRDARPAAASLRDFDYPSLERTTLGRGTPLTLYAVFSTDVFYNSVWDEDRFSLRGVFRSWLHAEKFMISQWPGEDSTTKLHVERISIQRHCRELWVLGENGKCLDESDSARVLCELESSMGMN